MIVPMTRPVLLSIGWLCVGLGILGLFVPMMPGVVFLIIAAACFSRSSPKFEEWLLQHDWLGPPVRQWRRHGAIPTRAKAVAVASLGASFGFVLLVSPPAIAIAGAGLSMVAVAAYIVTRPAPPAQP